MLSEREEVGMEVLNMEYLHWRRDKVDKSTLLFLIRKGLVQRYVL